MLSSQTNINDLLTICAKADPTELPLVDIMLQTIDPNSILTANEEPLLAVIIQNFSKYAIARTAMLPEYIRLFIRHGFNTALFGAPCLHALLSSVQDENLLTAAHLLIDDDAFMPPEIYREILADITDLAAYHEFQTHNYYLQNLFFAYRQLLINTFTPANPRYIDIAHYTQALQQPLLNICFNSLEAVCKHLYFILPHGILIMQNHPNIYMCASIESTIGQPLSLHLTPHFELAPMLCGQQIHSISFSYDKVHKVNEIQYYPTIHLWLTDHYLTVSRSAQTGALKLTLDGRLI